MCSISDDSAWLSGTVLNGPDTESHQSPIVLDPLTTLHFCLLIGDINRAYPVSDNLNFFRLGTRWVVYVDTYGIIRQLSTSSRFFTAEIDDGTGSIDCTIWRNELSETVLNQPSDPSSKITAFAKKLASLAARTRPGSCFSGDRESAGLQVGSAVHIRGRLNFFREKIAISAYYCRLVSDPEEMLHSVVRASHLMQDVYSQNYNPVEITNNLISGHLANKSIIAADKVREVIEKNKLFTFSQLDLQLHSVFTDIFSREFPTLDDEIFYGPESENPSDCALVSNDQNCLTSSQLKKRVRLVIDRLLATGFIYPCNNQIIGFESYKYTLCDPDLTDLVCRIVSSSSRTTGVTEVGVSFDSILACIRQNRTMTTAAAPNRYCRLSKQALRKIIDNLIEESRIYCVYNNRYLSALNSA